MEEQCCRYDAPPAAEENPESPDAARSLDCDAATPVSLQGVTEKAGTG